MWEKMHGLNLNNSYVGGGDFSHAYIIVRQYFDLQVEMKKYHNKLWWEIKHVLLYNYFMYLWLTPNVRNSKLNQHKQLPKWPKKRSFPSIVPFGVNIKIGSKNHVRKWWKLWVFLHFKIMLIIPSCGKWLI